MAVNLGTAAIADVKLGTTQVEKIYLGNEQVWGGSPAPADPQYGEVVLYGYTETQTTLSNVTGGTVTVTDDDSFKAVFSGQMTGQTIVLPVSVTITGSDPSSYYAWNIVAIDANGTRLDTSMMMIDPGISISGVSGSFTVSFRIDSFKSIAIDKTTTTTRTLDSAAEFNQLAPSNNYVLTDVPASAVQSVKVGSSITAIPNYFLSGCTNLQSLTFSRSSSLTSIGNYFLSYITSSSTTLSEISLPNGLQTIGTNFMSSSTAYNQPLTLPNSVTSIGQYFMSSNSSFNSPVTLSTSLTSIPNYFMQPCSSFNQPLVIPDGVTSIGQGFMSGCTAFNSTLTLSSTLTSIGNTFLYNCRAFNKTLTLPSTLTQIGDSFLATCYGFNQAITLPGSLTSVGTSFMSNLRDMVSAVNIGTLPATAFAAGNYTLSAYANSAAAYTTGITIIGTNRADFITRFPDRTSIPYRKLIDGGA